MNEVPTGVNLVYLMDLIGHYATHAEERAAIGTPGEQERIYALLWRHRQEATDDPAPWRVHSGA
jgi:hypothetical protein